VAACCESSSSVQCWQFLDKLRSCLSAMKACARGGGLAASLRVKADYSHGHQDASCRLLDVSYPVVATISTCVGESKACSVVSLRIYVHLLGLPVKVKTEHGAVFQVARTSSAKQFTPKDPLLTSHSRLQSNSLTLLAVDSTAYLCCVCVTESHQLCHGYESAWFVGHDSTGVSVLTILPLLSYNLVCE